MATKTAKQAIEPIAPPDVMALSAAPGLDIESMIADQLLDSVDWQKVKQALLKKAPARLFAWFQSQILPIDGDRMILNEVDAMALSEREAS